MHHYSETEADAIELTRVRALPDPESLPSIPFEDGWRGPLGFADERSERAWVRMEESDAHELGRDR